MSAVSSLRLTTGLALATAALWAHATDTPRPAPPLWEVGVFALGASQQAYPGSDTRLNRSLALPYLVYRGQWLRADRDTVGLRALKTDRLELDLGVAGAFGGGSDEVEARRGMRELGTLVELGPRLKIRLGDTAAPASEGRWRLDLPLRGVFDLSDGASHRGLAFEPRLVFERAGAGGWRYGASLSAILADRRLAHDFYGVSPQDVAPGRPAYEARSGLVSTRLAVSLTRSLGPDWRLFALARVDTVQGAANESSPLVRQKNGSSLAIGLSYTLARSRATAHD